MKKININLTYLLWFLIVVINLYKFVLINAGFMTEPDERRYLMSFSFLKHLSQADLPGAFTALFSANGRPAGVLWHSIPAGLQFISAKIRGLEIFETQNFQIVFVYNFIINLLILYILYKIFRLVFKSEIISLTGLLFYSVLVNNFSYLRHIYPYNESLFVFLLLIWWLLKRQQEKLTYKYVFMTGAIAFFGFLIYPAFYLSFIAVWLFLNLIVWQQIHNINKILIYNFVFFSGSLTVLFLFEVLARIGNTSYINNVLYLSETVTQGSFEESFSFLIKYMWQVEKITGVFLLVGLLVFLIFLPGFIQNQTNKTVLYIFISFIIPFLLYASVGYFFHKMVFYGRILHQFMFVIILANLYVLSRLKSAYQKQLIFSIALIISLQFVGQIQDYLKITYPRDVYWQYLKTYPFTHIKQVSEYDNFWSNLPQKLDSLYIEKNKRDSIIIVNGQYFYPVDDKNKYKVYKNNQHRLIFEKPHFLNYKAYQFEGYGIEERRLIDSLQFQIKIYR